MTKIKVKRLYEMTGSELREEADRAEARGDRQRAVECWEQFALARRIVESFQESPATRESASD
jgi:hypothetical protein